MMTQTVPKFRLEFDAEFRRQFRAGCDNILRSDCLAEGPYVREFEKKFGEFIGADYCVATSNGTSALEISLRAVGVRGKEVVVPTNTFIATAIAAERAGGLLTVLDIEPETFALCPERLASKITEKTGAVVLVHIGGVISKYVEKIVEICRSNGVPLVEDAAHAHAACRGDYVAGRIGVAAAFSFFPTKLMTTGEGGAITTSNSALAGLMRNIKNFGRLDGGALSHVDGFNAKMTEFQGLLGTMEVERLPARAAKRMMLSGLYWRELRDTAFETMGQVGEWGSHYKEVVRTSINHAVLKAFCSERGVELAGEVYRFPLHRQPVFENRFGSDFPVANHFCSHHICPPLYPEMEVDDVKYVCEVLRAAQKEL